MPTNSDQPHGRWAYALHCCRECLRTMLPAWRETSVHISNSPHSFGLSYSLESLDQCRHAALSFTVDEIAAGDAATAAVVARRFEGLLEDLGPKKKKPNAFIPLSSLPPRPRR